MKRKFLIFFLAVVFALCLSVGLSACGFGSCSSCGGDGSTDVTDVPDDAGGDGSGDDGSGGVSGDIGHVYNFTRTEAVAATCIAEGNIEYWYCTDCGKYYSDENGVNEITLYDTVTAKTEHTVVVIEGVAATCTESGLTEGGYCSVCGEVLTEQKVIAATGHTASEWIVAKEATATENGVRHKVCTVCGEELESEPIVITQVTEGLEYAEVTDGDGNVIGYEVIGAGTVSDAIIYIPSEYNSLPVIGVAQQAFNGLDFLINLIFGENVSYIDRYAVYDCENLTDIFILNEAIEIDGRLFVYLCEKLENIYFGGNAGEWEDLGLIMDVDINISYNYAHSYVLTETHAATCEQDGYNVYVCADCGREYSEVISSAGHSWSVTESKDATCNDYGYSKVVCAVCGEEKNLINEATGHTVEVWEVVSEADCENNGLKIGVCVVCGESVYSYESATGHVASGIEYSDDSYCGEDKTGAVYCTVCGEILYSIGHNYVSTIKQATCEEDGLITYTCSKCGDVYTETLECGGHIEGEWQTEKTATCYSEGLEILCCVVCGKTLETRTVNKVAHSYANTRSSSEIVYTCTVCGYTYTEELASDSVLYTVTFVSNGGTEYDSLTVLEGTVIDLPEPKCEGYEFLGWYTDESFTTLYDGSEVTKNLTLYAGWTSAIEAGGESNTIETDVPTDYTFEVISDIALTDKNLSKYVTVTDIEGNAVDEYIFKTDDNVYTIAPEKEYEKGSTYIITIDPELSFGDKDGCEVWIVTGGENYNNIEYKSDVTFVSADEVYGCYTDGENSYIYLYEDLLDVGDVVVVYDDSIEDIQYILEVTVAGVYDKYYAYQVIYADADEVFETYDIYSSGDISFEGFVAEDGFIEEIEEQLVTSALYSQFVTAAKNYAKVSGEFGDYYYDFNGVSYSGSYSATNNKVVVSLTITAAFSRMNTKTKEIEDVLEFKLVIKNDLTLGYNISVKSFNNFSFLTTTTNTTTFGLYASFHKNSNAKSELSYFKELFQKAQADGENDALDSYGASTAKEIKIGELSINLYGIKFGISLKNTFSFEAVGELGAEASVTITTTSGIIYTPDNGLSTKKEYKSSASLSFYAMCKITVSDTVSLEVSLGLIGLINISLGVSAGPYFEIGGMVAATVSTKGSAAIANGYLEIGIKLNVYAKLDISTTVLFWKVSFYSHTWNIYSTTHTFLSVGTKSMPLYYDVKNESFEITLDVTQSYDLTTLVDGNVVYQNLTSFSTSTKSVKSSYYIIDGSDYFTLTSGGKLTLTSKVGYTALVLQIKVYCDGIYKTVTVTVNVTHSEASVSYSAPTCFNNGQTAYTYCKVCGMILSGTNEVIPKLQHDYSVEDVSSATLRGEATCIVKETHWYVCSLCGTKSNTLYFEVGDYSPHTYADGYTCHDRTCTVCGYLCEATTEHNFSEWIEVEGGACTEEAYSMRVCLDCKYSELSLDTSQAVHCDLQLKEEVAATCTEGGYIIFACTRCGNEVKVETDALGHNYEWVKTEEEHYLICRNEGCGDIISRDEHTSSGEATCTEDEKCVICGYVINSAAGHNYEYVEEKEPTCEERGYTSYLMCSVCGDTIGFKYIAALGHIWDSGVVSLDATCTDAGEMLYTCSVCGATKTEEIEATGHDYKSTVTAPTCTEQGYTTYVCANCGDTYVDNYVKAAGHTEGKAVTENYVEATCTTDGSYDTVIYCTVCGKELNRKTTKITAYGHTWDEGKVTTEPACTTEGVTTYTCTVCGETKTESIKSLGHDYELSEIIKEPTYTETGLYAYACTRCGDTYTKDIAVLGHTHEYEGVITKEPTCTEDGVMTYTCKYCDDAYTEAIPATGHKLVYVEAREATCTEVGWYAYEYCTACDYTTYKEIPATGHTFVYVEAQAATCTEKGWYAYEYCTVCGYSTYIEISATGHTKVTVKDNEVAATCTTDGSYDTVIYCTTCGEVFSRETTTVSAFGHTKGKAVTENYVAATCTTDGSYDTVIYCTTCGEELSREANIILELGHTKGETVTENYVALTCTTDGSYDTVIYCTACGEELSRVTTTITAKGHSWDNGEVIADATCAAAGVILYTCTVCGETKTEEIPVLAHVYNNTIVTAPTCTEQGYTTYVCANCGYTFVSDYVSATGHEYNTTVKKPTCTEQGYTTHVCANCGDKYVSDYVDPTGHNYKSVVTDPTCTEQGYTTHVCANCGDAYVSDYVDPTGHNYKTSVTYPTCTEQGYTTYLCANCGDRYVSDYVEAYGHSYGEWLVVTAATCTQDGQEMRVCSVCGDIEYNVTDKLGHDYVEHEAQAATCTQIGWYAYDTCSRCDYSTYEEIPALGHVYEATWQWTEDYSGAQVTISCTRCGLTAEISATVSSTVTTSATCEEDGAIKYTARATYDDNTYSDTQTAVIPATGHNWSAEWSYTSSYHYHACLNDCGGKADIAAHEESLQVIVTREEVSEGVTYYVHTMAYVCDICGRVGETLGSEILHYHSSVEILAAVDPSCESTGLTMGWKCGECDFVYQEQEVVAALGHTYSDWVEEVPATCSQTGTLGHYTCTRCGKYFDASYNTLDDLTISTTNHTLLRSDGSIVEIDESLVYDVAEYGELTSIGTPATCTTQGTAYFTCNVCGQQIVLAVVDTNNHTLGGYEYDEDNHWQTCMYCGKTFTEAHTMSNNACTVCGYSQAASGELAYELSSDNTYYTVTGIGTYTGTEVIIPETYKGLPVTAIGSEAFYGDTSITSITIGENVTSIGTYAFYNCTALTEINFNATAMDDLSSSNCVFYCAGQSGTGITVTIGVNVTKIPAYLFYPYYGYSPKITSVVFEEGSVCTSIGSCSFRDCTSLTSIIIPNSVTSIGGSAFRGCASLTSVIIGDSVTSIGSYAFYNCNSLTSVTIGSGVTSIDNRAFSNCTALKEINFNAIAMDDLSSLNYVFYKAGQSSTGITVTIGVNVTKISANLFSPSAQSNAPKITSVVFEEGSVCTSIGSCAFYGCTSLTSVTIGDSVTSIGSQAFLYCTSLTSVTIGNGVTSIGSSAFHGCYKLVEVYNLSSLKITAGSSSNGYVAYYAKNVYTATSGASNLIYEGDYIFYNDNGTNYLVSYTGSDTEITLPDGVNGNSYKLYDYGFYKSISLLSVTIPDSVTSIGEYTFYNCTALTSVTIGDGVTSIEYSAFSDCTSLTSIEVISDNTAYKSIDGNLYSYDSKTLIQYAIGKTDTSFTIPDGVTSIGYYAFYHCSSLISIIIPDSVTSIGDSAFYYCTSLESITIPNGVTTIGDYAFYHCTSLTSITIPDSVTSIGSSAFNNTAYYNDSNNWENNVLYIGNYLLEAKNSISGSYTIKDGTTIIADSAFDYCTALTSITIPDSVTFIGDYAFYYCSSLISIIIPDSVTSIGDYAFSYCTSLTSIIIPDSVTSIGEVAFCYCTALTSITIPDSVTSIGNYAFSDCTSLTSVTIGNGVISIGYRTFYNCTSLTSVTIGDSVTSIGDSAFYWCTSLESITIPNGVTTIGDYAFDHCTSLTSVTIGDGVTSIGYCAFYNCTLLTSVTIPDSVTSIGNYAFSDCTLLTSVTIGNGVISIGYRTFSNCTSLTSVTFENTEGWYVTRTSGATSGTDILSTDLSDTSTAATYLKTTYYYYYWYRNDD